jgi:hypothetical protein
MMGGTMAIKSFVDGLHVSPAWSHLNLTVHPLLLGAPRSTLSYLTLDEALATRRFRVGEISMRGSVPELKVSNDLPKSVLLLDGQELIGAKQNRVLNLTIMVPPDSEMTIPVSCVEAGRWRHVSDAFMAADRAQFARGRAKKLAQVSYALRESGTRGSDQIDVWNEIAAKAARMSAASPTSAMSAIYERTQTKLDEFIRAMPRRGGQVGAVFSIGGRVAGIDVFDSTDTFAKAAPKLVRSYAVDALERRTVSVTNELATDAVRAFLGDIADAGVTRFKALGVGDDLRLAGRGLAGAALEISGQIVHLVSFPRSMYEDYGDRHQPADTYMTRARTGRAYGARSA